MRIILAGAAGAMIASLAACGPGSAFDNSVRDQFKTTAVESCVSSSRGSPVAAQIDFNRLCNCAIDRYMGGKTTEQLRNADPNDPALRSATEQCMRDQIGGAMGAAGANQSTGSEAGGEGGGEGESTE